MAKLIAKFDEFLKNTVNLNQTRVDVLEGNVVALKDFIRASGWKAKIKTFIAQGSWAHKTIIKPVDQGEFDADLLVLVYPVEGWTARDYVLKLGEVFKGSGLYSSKSKTHDYCVTVTYAGDQQVDIAPCVVNRQYDGQREVCNRKLNQFELTAPEEYTDWLIDRNAISGGNSFRKATRLIKYVRDENERFDCSSVLLTTLLGSFVNDWERGSDVFSDVPTTLQTLMRRLDDFLQARPQKPSIPNPKLLSEDFAASLSEPKYRNLRKQIHRYRKWVDEAVALDGIDASILAWRKVFGDQFAKGVEVEKSNALSEGLGAIRGALLSSGAHLSGLVDAVQKYGVATLPRVFRKPPHVQKPDWDIDIDLDIKCDVSATVHPAKGQMGTAIQSGQILHPGSQILFDVVQRGRNDLPAEYRVEWRVTNTGEVAMQIGQGRGGFERPSVGYGNRRWESLKYRGVHFVEAFIIRRSDNFLVGQSKHFFVVVT